MNHSLVVDGMPLANQDTLYLFAGLHGCESWCRVRIWRPIGRPVIAMVSELDTNPGTSVTNAAESLWQAVSRDLELPTDAVMVEHYPPSSVITGHTFTVVTFEAGHPHWEHIPRSILVAMIVPGGSTNVR